jgi:catechol 2,3-dioxygenase-like lactoylglutathione lyase family enzyme
MKIRTVYFKVSDMQKAVAFWKSFLEIEPHKTSERWHEFMVGTLRLGLLLADPADVYSGSNCVPVFEFLDNEMVKYVERAKSLGAAMIIDGLDDPNLLSVVFADPFGNEFEVSKFHN